VGDARGQRVDVAVAAVEAVDLARDPVLGQARLGRRQEAEHLAQQPGVLIGQDVLEVRHLADLPEQAQGAGVAGQRGEFGISDQRRQRAQVVGLARAREFRNLRAALQALEQRLGRAEIQLAAAPIQGRQGIEAVGLDRLDDLGREAAGLAGGAKAAVGHVAPGAPGDLGDFGRAQSAHGVTVELGQLGEGDVVQIQIEAHADSVGGDQIVDLAGLEHGDLGVARARAERAQHHRGAAALAPYQLGQGIDLGHGEGDHRRARRQAGQLARAAVAERRKARPGDGLGFRHQPPEQRADGVGAEEHGFRLATGVQQAVGEDMAPVRIGAKLDLVDRQERHRPVERHGFHGAEEIARARRHDSGKPIIPLRWPSMRSMAR
jgi:hypothetical protein